MDDDSDNYGDLSELIKKNNIITTGRDAPQQHRGVQLHTCGTGQKSLQFQGLS
jgi:hypothetical protein